VDQDQDGWRDADCNGPDCDDQDPAIHPHADEVCDDGVDNDCDDLTDGEDGDCAAGDDDGGDDDDSADEAPDGCLCRHPAVGGRSVGWPLGVLAGLAVLWLTRREG